MIQKFIHKKYLPVYILVFIFVGIVVISLMPSTGIKSQSIFNIPNFDKIGHFIAYLAFSFFAGLVFSRKQKYMIALILGFVLGIVLEKIQSFIPGRSMSIFDVYANTAGLISGFIVIYFLQKK